MNSIYDGRLLVVDDNEELCRMLTDMLHREGFRQVYTAGTCAQALSFFEAAGGQAAMPDLVILDINLPDGDGFSLMQKIRLRSQTPVLFLSARDEDNDRLLGLGLGADDYMTKPFLPKELALRITAILRRTWFSQARQEEAGLCPDPPGAASGLLAGGPHGRFGRVPGPRAGRAGVDAHREGTCAFKEAL